MKEIMQKHKIKIWIAVAVILLIIFATWQRNQVLEKATVTKLKDEPRQGERVTSEFYSNQLTKKEFQVYELLEERLEQKQGGIVELPAAVNGEEYTRIINALECEGGNYFYGMYDIPMTEDGVYVKYKKDDLLSLKEDEIAKVMLFLSCAEGIDEPGEYAEDGTVMNLEKINEGLSVNVPEKVAEIDEISAKTEMILEEIMAGLPSDAGEKSAVDYFLDWMENNLEFVAEDIQKDASDVEKMSEVFEKLYKPNQLSAVTDGKATALGYAKILAELCNRAGMESHVVMGFWKGSMISQETYVFCAVSMNGQTIYVDASGGKSGVLADHRYLTEEEAKNHMDFVPYFEYDE